MTKRNFNITSADDQVIAENFKGGDHAFYSQDLDDDNVSDLLESIQQDKMVAIVSEEHGGIIGYMLNEAVADDLTTVLNLHTIERTQK